MATQVVIRTLVMAALHAASGAGLMYASTACVDDASRRRSNVRRARDSP